MSLNASISTLKGIGPKTEKLFHHLGVYTVGDILLNYPKDYQRLPDITDIATLEGELKENEIVAIFGRIVSVPVVKNTSNFQITTTQLTEQGVSIRFTWFRMPYLKNSLKPGERYVFLGKLIKKGQFYAMEQPQVFAFEKYDDMHKCLWPCYALTAGLGKNMVSKTVKSALLQVDAQMDYLREDIRIKHKLEDYHIALHNIHFPTDEQAWESARKRLVFDEFFQFTLAAQMQKQQMEEVVNNFIFPQGQDAKAEEVLGNANPKEAKAEEVLGDANLEEAKAEEVLSDANMEEAKAEEVLSDANMEEAKAEAVLSDANPEESKAMAVLGDANLERVQQDSTTKETMVERVLKMLPFTLTNAQLRTHKEIYEDMRKPKIMQRLVQGDVGSGKTILAFLAMLDVACADYQSALMAPTEVLATQHYQNFCHMCESYRLNIPVILLTGSMTAKEKRRAYTRMQLYKNAMVIGTHALIQEKALFDNLALVVTDEQHRFGVKQREHLFLKGNQPHVLVMSATPIPRTLAIILYGDLDISVVDEVPEKRLPIKSCVVSVNYRQKSYEFIKSEINKGRQAYIICPLVEESEGIEAENVLDYSAKIQDILGSDIQVSALHGKMKAKQKNKIMEQFLSNNIQVLVATTVIEVGVDAPNATVMLIEDAQRFGLAQLHQLRGRVGRGEAQSYCIMVNNSDSEKSKKRLDILNKSNDGFFIASEDLKLRGPGDFFGIRQSGLLEFKLGDIYQDADFLKIASEEAKNLLKEDAALADSKNIYIKQQMERFMEKQAEIVNL
ncbi:DEAD/DEAH box helicase [Lachnospiraceae bacterium ZAX-1]